MIINRLPNANVTVLCRPELQAITVTIRAWVNVVVDTLGAKMILR